MTATLVRKLLRDVRWPLLGTALLLLLFQFLWVRITARILGDLAPLFNALAGLAGLRPKDLEAKLFEGPNQIARTIIGGDNVQLDNAMDLLSVGYVHPLVQTVLCVWAVGRAAGAIAGEIDRGTMELLLAQPLARARLILAHLLVDLIVIPILCLSLWAGTGLGKLVFTPIQVHETDLQSPLLQAAMRQSDPVALERRLRIEPLRFGRALWAVGGLLFAVSGATMALSAAGRFRWRVLLLAVALTLLMFLANVLGQLWPAVAWARPLTVFYYYQPQQLIQGGGSAVGALVLCIVGTAGYLLALLTLSRRDLPAPL